MINVVWCHNPVNPKEAEKYLVEFVDGMTVIEALPADARSTKHLVIWQNGRQVGPKTPAKDGDFIQGQVEAQGTEIVVGLIISLAGYVVARALAPDVEAAKERDDEKSPTFGFRGIKSNRTDGEVMPIVYGRIRVGGQIINEFIESRAEPGVDKYAFQISFGFGPIKSIGGFEVDTPEDEAISTQSGSTIPSSLIFFDDQPADVFADVELYVRLGSLEQIPVPGFEYAQQTFPLGVELTAGETTAIFSSDYRTTDPDGNPDAADDAIIWDIDGYEYDLNADEYDAAIVTVRFPRGLFFLNQTLIDIAHFAIMFRYQALTDAGVPITTGGNFNDGWVRERARPFFSDNKREAFSLNFLIDLFEPQGYIPSQIGGAVRFAIGNSGHVIVDQAATNNWPVEWSGVGSSLDEFSFDCWIRLEDRFPATGPNANAFVETSGGQPSQGGATIAWWGNWNGASPGIGGDELGGFRLHLQLQTFTTGPATTIQRLVPKLRFFNQGAATPSTTYENSDTNIGAPSFVVSGEQWTHIGVTYKANVDGSRDRLRIYGNGQLLIERIDNMGAVTAGTPNLTVLPRQIFSLGRANTLAQFGFPGRIDEPHLWRREISPGLMSSMYNFGRGVYGTDALRTEHELVAGWHLDALTGTGGNVYEDFTNNGIDMILNGGITPQDGFVDIPASGNQRRTGKWRIGIARANLDSNDTRVTDDVEIDSVSGLIDEEFSYPGEPTLSGRIRASEQLSDQIPDVSAIVEGRLCPVWDEQNADRPTFLQRYSQNPAHVASDVVLSLDYGMARYGLTVDAPSAKEFADHCDELIYDLKERRDSEDSGATDGFTNILYWEDPGGIYTGRGRLTFQFGEDGPPEHWQVGGYVGTEGVNVIGGQVDINQTIGGYEIAALVDLSTTNRQVHCYWDRLDEGHPLATTINGDFDSEAGGPLTGTVEGREVRFRYDGVFDREQRLWDALVQICSTARTVPFRDGNKIRFKTSRARSPVNFVCNANIERDTFEVDYGGQRDLPNFMTIDFLDEDFNYERLPAEVKHPVVENADSSVPIVEESRFVRGVTRRSQIMRSGRWELNVNQTLKRRGRFISGPQLLHLDPGDLFYIGHDLMPWGDSGKILERNTTAPYQRLELDREITFEAATTYYVRVRNMAPGAGTADFETVEVDVASTGGAGTYAAGSEIHLSTALSFQPRKDSDYLLYEDGAEKIGEVINVRLTDDLRVEFDWVEYDETVFDDLPTENAIVGTTNTAKLNLFSRFLPGQTGVFLPTVGPGSITVVDVPTLGSLGGSIGGGSTGGTLGSQAGGSISLQVSWNDPPQEEAASEPPHAHRIWVRDVVDEDQANPTMIPPWSLVGEVPSGTNTFTFQPRDASYGKKYVIAVQPMSRNGARAMALDRCPSRGYVVTTITSTPAPVTNLEVDWVEGRAVYSWDLPDSDLVVEGRFGGWNLGQPAFKTAPGEQSTPATRAWGTGDLYVRTRDPQGRYSEAVVLTLSPDVPRRTDVIPLNYQNQEWADFGSGWQN